ncbi:MAG: hypothetical protein ACRDPY_34345 [Streptosporangiaceae bacterium]
MESLSDPTVGILIEAAADGLKTGDIKTMLMRADLYGWRDHEEYEYNKLGMLRSHLLAARDNASYGNDAARRGLLTFARLVVERTVRTPERPPTWFGDLRQALLADGYELTWELEEDDNPFGPARFRYQILPTDPAPVPLGPEISALEAELASRGYTSVLEHYRDAVDGLTNHKYGSANGDLRTTLEDLVTRLAEDHAGYPRPDRANTGWQAIGHLIQGSHLPERDGGAMLRGLWQMIQTNGPHPGQTDADEARWRMQMVTATARFLLRQFPARG